jgi:hypothetical protein
VLKILITSLAVSLFLSVNAEAAVSKRQISSWIGCRELCEGPSLVRVCIRPTTRVGQLPVMNRELIRFWDSRCAGVR